jgi:hypothetical protein
VPHYRLYYLTPRYGHIDRAHDIFAIDDTHAIDMVAPLRDGHPMELWCDTRKVQRFTPPATGSGNRF